MHETRGHIMRNSKWAELAQNRVKPQLFSTFYPDLYRLFESYFYHVAADELTSPNGGKFH